MKAFTTLMTPAQARARFAEALAVRPLGTEWVALLQASGRVLAEEIRADADLPSYDRSTVDGYAVRSADTADASKGAPVPLRVAGEVLMGTAPATLKLAGWVEEAPNVSAARTA